MGAAAKRSGLSRSFFYHAVLARTVPYFKINAAVRFDFDQLDAWFASHAVDPIRALGGQVMDAAKLSPRTRAALVSIFEKLEAAEATGAFGTLGPRMVLGWLPDGHAEGSEWVARNQTQADAHPGSFKVNKTTGAWSDFATGDKGGEAVSLLAYLRGVSQAEAARMLLGPSDGTQAPTMPGRPTREKADPVFPVPDDATSIKAVTRSSFAVKTWGTAKGAWSYTDRNGPSSSGSSGSKSRTVPS